jgi:ribosomal protein S18 acetylase RimI-like enzyme
MPPGQEPHPESSKARPLVVRRMAPDELDAACELIAAAFESNPSTLANVRGDRGRARLTMARAVRLVKLASRWSYVLVAERDGELVGLLNAVEWPHCQMGTAQKLRHGPAMFRAMGSALPRAAAMMSARAKHDPHEPHWHIGPLGVHPSHQGGGIGSQLLGAFLERVDRQGATAFLETDVDRNVVLYERFGFTVVAAEQIIGVNTRFMSRVAIQPVREAEQVRSTEATRNERSAM